MSGKHRWLASVLALGLILTLVFLNLFGSQRPTDGSTPDSRDSQAIEVAKALEALETDPGALLPAALKDDLGSEAEDAIPKGTTVVADPGSWEASSSGGGVIRVDLKFPDGSDGSVFAVMGQEDGQWKVLQTIPIESGS